MTRKQIKEIVSKVKQLEKEGQFEEANSLVKSLIQDLFRDKDYQEIVSVLNSDLCKEKELFYNFEVAYALNEVGNVDQAEVVYETILVWDENNPAVLNNLSNIKKAKGKIKEAFDLIQKAKNLEPNDDIINRNYENLLNIINEQAAIEQNYKNAIKFVQNENEFVINKLTNFLFNIKKDKVFKNNRIPIPN